MRYVEVACRLLLTAVFVVAAYNKLTSRSAWRDFVGSLRQWRQVPDALVRPAAVAAVTAEVLISVLLLVPVRAVGALGFALAAGLLLAFTVLIGLALAHGSRAPCRCFGASSTPLGPRHVVRNLLLLGVAGLGLASTSTGGTLDVPYAVIFGLGGLVVGLLVTAADDLVALFARRP